MLKENLKSNRPYQKPGAGQKAKQYLETRHIDEELIKEFGIGLALDNMNALTTILLNKDYSIKELDQLGLSSNNHDAYINRIMFPLHDISGKIVGLINIMN